MGAPEAVERMAWRMNRTGARAFVHCASGTPRRARTILKGGRSSGGDGIAGRDRMHVRCVARRPHFGALAHVWPSRFSKSARSRGGLGGRGLRGGEPSRPPIPPRVAPQVDGHRAPDGTSHRRKSLFFGPSSGKRRPSCGRASGSELLARRRPPHGATLPRPATLGRSRTRQTPVSASP
jgi:hypothetical protein